MMRKLGGPAAVAAAAGLLAPALAGKAGAQSVQAAVDAAVEEAGAPGAAAAVWKDGTVAAEFTAGERAKGSGAPIEPGDLWHLGSNTKAMTAALIARLADQGRLSRDLTVGEALGDAIPDMDPAWRDVRLEELLSHTSGMAPNAGVGMMFSLAGTDAGRDARADRIAYARAVLKDAPPGARGEFAYSNAGYVVAGAMVEAALDAPYETLMQTDVFAPLGLDSAGFGPPGTPGQMDAPRGHVKRFVFFGGPQPREPGATADNPPALSPAGRAHMSLPDYLTFVDDAMACARGGPSALVSAEGCAWLMTVRNDAAPYALGWGVRPDGALSHSGSNTMWLLTVTAWPERDLAVVAAVNDGRVGAMQPALNRILNAAESEYGD